MNKKYILLLISLCYFSVIWGQNNAELSKRVKAGVFYYYPKDSKESSYIIRNDSVQEEINLVTNDTLIFRIKWQNDTLYSTHYLTGTKKLSDFERSFLNGHTVVTRINHIASEFYTFSLDLDKVSGIGDVQDTLWFKPRVSKN